MPSVDGNANRETSGLGGSILMTSAPRSCKVRAHSGPASTREKSTTRIPLKGPLISTPLEFCETRAVLAERGKTRLQVFRSPYWRLDICHCLIGCDYTLVDRNVHELFR